MNKIIISASVILLLTFSLSLTYAKESNFDYQTTLLNLYTQQLVAHGASLFAAAFAAFTFITHLIPNVSNSQSPWRRIMFILFSSLLLSLCFYLGFKLILYGYLANGTIEYEPLIEHESLRDYQSSVTNFVLGGSNQTLGIIEPIQNLISKFSSYTFQLGPLLVCGFSFSWFLGFFFSNLICFSFILERPPRKWKWSLGLLILSLIIPLLLVPGTNFRGYEKSWVPPDFAILMLFAFIVQFIYFLYVFMGSEQKRLKLKKQPKDTKPKPTPADSDQAQKMKDVSKKKKNLLNEARELVN